MTSSNVPTTSGVAEYRRSSLVFLVTLGGAAVGAVICLVPLILPNPDLGHVVFFGVIGIPLFVVGIVSVRRLSGMVIQVTDRLVRYRYARLDGEIERSRIAHVHVALGYFSIYLTDGSKVILPLYFANQRRLIRLLRERPISS